MESVDRMVKALDHEESDMVPQNETFGQAEARDLFFPHDVESSPEWVLKESRWWGRDVISVSINAPNLLSEVLVSEPGRTGYSIVREAWGSITYSRRIPGFHKVIRSPVVWPEDLDRIDPPPLPSYESSIANLAKMVQTYKDAGFFVEAFHNGPFVMSWHRLRGMRNFLMDLVRDRPFARRLVDFAMDTQLELTKAVIDEVKPHAIRLGNDMGTNESLFFPPKTYMEIFNPWERKLCREYHDRGMFVFHHCHGNINLILNEMVAAGVDAIDPMDPDDGIDLAEVKEKYGDKITLRGGISKYIGTYDREGIHRHIVDRFNIGSPGGGYIVQSAGGLPHDMPKENFHYFKETMAKLRKYPR
jgi:uroporphyrinogen decarboxylase